MDKRSAELEKNDPGFVEDIKKSAPAVWVVAKWLWKQGNTVIIPPIKIRPNIERRLEYSDSGDVFFIPGGGINMENGILIEVKHRKKLIFTCADDYRFKTVFVDTCHKYERKQVKPYAYFAVNKNMTHAAVTRVKKTIQDWRKKTIFDEEKGREEIIYECPIRLVDFERLD
jgi:hypothetical protein